MTWDREYLNPFGSLDVIDAERFQARDRFSRNVRCYHGLSCQRC